MSTPTAAEQGRTPPRRQGDSDENAHPSITFLASRSLSGSSISLTPKERSSTYVTQGSLHAHQHHHQQQVAGNTESASAARQAEKTMTYESVLLEMENSSNITLIAASAPAATANSNTRHATATRTSPPRSPGRRSPLSNRSPKVAHLNAVKEMNSYSFPNEATQQQQQQQQQQPHTTRSQKLRLKQRSLSSQNTAKTSTTRGAAAASGTFQLSSTTSPAAFYSSTTPLPTSQPTFPPGKVLKASRRTTSKSGSEKGRPTRATYELQYSQHRPERQRGGGTSMAVSAHSANLHSRAAARDGEQREVHVDSAAVPIATDITAADDLTVTKSLSPLRGLLAMHQQLGVPPAFSAEVAAKQIGTDLTRRIPVAKTTEDDTAAAAAGAAAAAWMDPASLEGPLLPAPATNGASATAVAAGEESEAEKDEKAVKRLFGQEMHRRLAEATRQAEERRVAAMIADAAESGVDDQGSEALAAAAYYLRHQRQQHPIDYQLCFQEVTDPGGAEMARVNQLMDSEASTGNVGYVQNQGLKVVDRRNTNSSSGGGGGGGGGGGAGTRTLSSQAAALLQDPLTLLACEHLLEDASKQVLSASPSLTSKLTASNTGKKDGASDAVQFWIAEANHAYSSQQQQKRREAGGQDAVGVVASIPRSVLKPIPPPGKVFVQLSYPAKVLLSAVLYVRALGGFPTLLRVGPLTDMSPVVDKENCIELVFWNPKLDEAEQRRRQRRQQQMQEELDRERRAKEAQARANESVERVNDIQSRLVRTLSAVMAPSSVASPARAGEEPQDHPHPTPQSSRHGSFLLSPSASAGTGGGGGGGGGGSGGVIFGSHLPSPQHSALGRHSSFHSTTPGLLSPAASGALSGSQAPLRTHTSRSAQHQQHPATAGAGGGGSGSTPSHRLSVTTPQQPSVTFDGGSALMGCEHDDAAPLHTHRAGGVGHFADAGKGYSNSMSSDNDGSGIPRVVMSDPAARRRLRRSSTSSAPSVSTTTAQGTGGEGRIGDVQSPMTRAANLMGLSNTSLPSAAATTTDNSDTPHQHRDRQQRPPPATPTKKGSPLITEPEDELCVVLRAVLAQKSKVYRFGEEETVHVLPPLPKEIEDVRKQMLRDAALDRLAIKDSDPLYRFLQDDDDAKKEAQARRKALLTERARRLAARGPVVVDEDGVPSAEDYGDLVVAMLLSGEASQLSGVLPDAMELEALRYRIFSLQGYSTKDPYDISGRTHHNGGGGSALASPQSRGHAESILVPPAQSSPLRHQQQPSLLQPPQGTALTSRHGAGALRRESSFQVELSRSFGIVSTDPYPAAAAGDHESGGGASPSGQYGASPGAGAAATATAPTPAAEAQRREKLSGKGLAARRYATAFPLYRASSVSERTLARYHAEERAAAAAARRLRRGGGSAHSPPLAPENLGDKGDGDWVNLREDLEEALRFRPFNYNGFYEELRDAVQYALDVQVRQTKEKVMQAFHM